MFAEVKLFQVKPEKFAEFEQLIKSIEPEMRSRSGCVSLRHLKRFYVLEDLTPRELTKIVKCVKYYSYWEFDGKESYTAAIQWFFATHAKAVQRLLIVPFDISCGENLS